MVSTIDFTMNFLSKNKIEPIPENNSLEILNNDIGFNYNLKSVKYQNKKYFQLVIDKVNERLLSKFFKSLDDKRVLNSQYQLKISAYLKNKGVSSFLIEQNEDEIDIKTYLEEVNCLEERIKISMKILDLMKNLNKEMAVKDNNTSLFFISIDNFFYNKLTKTIKVLYYGFELTIIELGLPIDDLKKKVINYCPRETLKTTYKQLNKEKLNIYIAGAIIYEIFSNKIPWSEKNSDACQNYLENDETNIFIEGKEELRNNLNELAINTNEKQSLFDKIESIIESAVESKFENRNINFEEMEKRLKDLIPNLDQTSCDLCEGFKEKAEFYCKKSSKFFCSICKHSCSSEEIIKIVEFIAVDFNGILTKTRKLANEVKVKDFADIKKEIVSLQDYSINTKKKIIKNIDNDLQNYIDQLTEFKNTLQDNANERIEKEDDFYKNLLEFFEKTETFKTDITEKYCDNLNEIEMKVPEMVSDYKLLLKNYSSIKSINLNLGQLKNDLFNNYYGGYDILYSVFNDINNKFKNYSEDLSNFFKNTFTINITKYKSELNFEKNQKMDKYASELNVYKDIQNNNTNEENSDIYKNDEKIIKNYSDQFSLIVDADELTKNNSNESEIRKKLSNRKII